MLYSVNNLERNNKKLNELIKNNMIMIKQQKI